MPWAIRENLIKRADNPAVDGGQEARDSDDGERFVLSGLQGDRR